MKRNTIFIAAAAAATAGLILFTGCKEDPEGPPAGDGFTLTTTANPAAGGDVTKSPNRTSYSEDDAVLVTATAKPGYTFSGWSGAASGTTNPVTVIMDRNKSLTANFTQDGDDPPIIPPGGHWYESDTSASTFTISTAAQLAELAELVNGGKSFANKTVNLANDISLAAYNGSNRNFNSGKGWVPIGSYNSNNNSNRPFAGIFNGNGKVVSGLFINDNASDNMALFGNVNGEIQNLGVENVNIYGRSNVGGVVGRQSTTTSIVENCYSTGTIRAAGDQLGGVAGYALGSVLKSYSTATFDGTQKVGGVVGYAGEDASVTESYYNGEINGTNMVGGVVGDNRGTVSDCYASGKVFGANDVGGVAGYLANGSINTSYSTSTISGSDRVGGILGSGGTSPVTNCYSTSNVTGSEAVGGIVGKFSNNGISISNCYSIGEVTGESRVGGIIGWKDGGWGDITLCAALNPNLNSTSPTTVNRVNGNGNSNTITGTAAFSGMTLNGEGKVWSDKGAGTNTGVDITVAEILSDPTMGNRFRTLAGWTIEPGKLPGLLGEPVDLPSHLSE